MTWWRAVVLLSGEDASDTDEEAMEVLVLYRARMALKERHYLTSRSLTPASSTTISPWDRIYSAREPSTFMVCVSMGPEAFDVLLAAFAEHYQFKHCTTRGGRPPKVVHKHVALSLVLHFYSAACEPKTLCELFGITPATMSRTLAKAEAALASALKSLDDAAIRFPSKTTQRRWARMVNRVEPLAQGVWGFLDGKNYRVKAPTAADQQNAYYNGWLHSTFVTGTLLFGVDGTIVWGRHNFVGSWNDADTSSTLRRRLLNPKLALHGHGVVSDSAFPVSGAMLGKIRTPLKDGDLDRASPACRAGLIRMSAALTSVRQAAEWGMGATEKVYRQLLLPLPCDPLQRGVRLQNMFMLYNFRVRRTGISQIRSVMHSS